jgi:hypothetical protein
MAVIDEAGVHNSTKRAVVSRFTLIAAAARSGRVR